MASKFSYLLFSLLFAYSFAFSVPTFGLGATLFQPKGLNTKSALGDPNTLLQASDFFVESFWTGKVGGGAEVLTTKQRKSLCTTQFKEFRYRYAGVNRGQAEMLVCELPGGEVVGCAGIEVTQIPQGGLNARPGPRAPLMSNLAISRKYRRKGIAEKLVKQAERVAQYEWGFKDCFLYVEERNVPAVKLYRKLGYRKTWNDDEATTLLPTPNGKLSNKPTKIICMKKRLDIGVLGRLWPF